MISGEAPCAWCDKSTENSCEVCGDAVCRDCQIWKWGGPKCPTCHEQLQDEETDE